MIELKHNGVICKNQFPVKVNYKGQAIGEYIADIVVEDKIILEIKAQEKIRPEHKSQLLNYLKATNMKIGFLINFTHPEVQIERFVL